MVMRPTVVGTALLLIVIGVLAARCGKNPAAPDANCGSGLSFTVLPVPFSAISSATPIGWMGPPGHTIPTDHGGFYVAGTGITLSSPGPFRITGVRTSHYLASTFRTGQSDYTVNGNLCNGYQLTLAHLQTVVS